VNARLFFDETCAQVDGGPLGCMALEAYKEAGLYDDDSNPTTCTRPGETAPHVCGDFGLKSEGYALKHSLGSWTLYMWAIGLFAAGQAATMVCTYAGQIIMGGCFEIKLSPWVRVAITRVFALGPALAVAVSTYDNQQLFNQINEYLNILQSVQLPFAMLPVLHFSAQTQLLGRFKSGLGLSVASTLLAFVVISVNIILIVQFIKDFSVGAIVVVCLYGVFYFFVCICMIWDELVALVNLPMRIYRGEFPARDVQDEFAPDRALEMRNPPETGHTS